MRQACVAAALALALLLSACSPAPQSAQNAPAAAAADSRAQEDLKLYLAMREKGRFELAAPIGEGILKRAPQSAAAATVRQTLDDTRTKAEAINEKRRLAGLWLYQTSEESGGTQHTASLSPSRPAQYRGRIRLILRRHSDWGESTYLYDTGEAGFVCPGSCKLPLTVDGKKAKPLRASPPPTGEPALFIDSKDRLLKLIGDAGKLTILVEVKGDGPRKLEFEVGGFDADKWPPLESGKR